MDRLSQTISKSKRATTRLSSLAHETIEQKPSLLFTAPSRNPFLEPVWVRVLPGPLVQGTALGGNYTNASYSNNPPYSNTTELEGGVYDPLGSNASQTLSVQLAAAGLIQNGSVVPIPSWMQVDLPQPFVLNASLPYYFHIGISTNPAHFGTYVISLQELENGQAFTDYLKIETCNNPSVVACP